MSTNHGLVTTHEKCVEMSYGSGEWGSTTCAAAAVRWQSWRQNSWSFKALQSGDWNDRRATIKEPPGNAILAVKIRGITLTLLPPVESRDDKRTPNGPENAKNVTNFSF